MTFDVCLVTYHSAAWLEACIGALAAAACHTEDTVNLYIADNASGDETVSTARNLFAAHAKAFGACEILPQTENRGFGAGCNAAARAGHGDYVFFCNVDTELQPDAFSVLSNAIACHEADFAAFELRQIPYEHPKYYDPVTLETDWASGACVAVKRTAFTAVGGFDENLFMYCEDVELSLRLRLFGFRIRYAPQAVIRHYAYETPGKRKALQESGTALGNLYLRYKYGSAQDIAAWDGLYEFFKSTFDTEAFGAQFSEETARKLPALRALGKQQRTFYRKEVKPRGFCVQWDGLDYTFTRGGAFFCVEPPADPHAGTRFSVLVRAWKRPESLALTLRSLNAQTYRNFEVIVIEDGTPPVCGDVAAQASKQLPIRYIPLQRQAGRCAAGNAALEAASGDYCVFLDDDDFFFADHLEALAQCIAAHPACGMVAMGSVEAQTRTDASGGQSVVVARRNRLEPQFSLAAQCMSNLFPIQSVAFARSLFLQYGGFDETLDLLEDWDVWTRYACHTDVYMGQKCTSLYHVPHDEAALMQRFETMASFNDRLREKWASYPLPMLTAADLFTAGGAAERQQHEAAIWRETALLRETAAALTHSSRWRLTAPLRALPALADALCGKRSPSVRAWRKRVGPHLADIPHADAATLRDFIQTLRTSLCWRLTGR